MLSLDHYFLCRLDLAVQKVQYKNMYLSDTSLAVSWFLVVSLLGASLPVRPGTRSLVSLLDLHTLCGTPDGPVFGLSNRLVGPDPDIVGLSLYEAADHP